MRIFHQQPCEPHPNAQDSRTCSVGLHKRKNTGCHWGQLFWGSPRVRCSWLAHCVPEVYCPVAEDLQAQVSQHPLLRTFWKKTAGRITERHCLYVWHPVVPNKQQSVTATLTNQHWMMKCDMWRPLQAGPNRHYFEYLWSHCKKFHEFLIRVINFSSNYILWAGIFQSV